MYERNAIILERYFDKMFGYDMKYNIKTNFVEYSELIKCLEEYKNISEEEEAMASEYDAIANKIRETQKRQDALNKKNVKLQEERNALFQNLDDNSASIQKKADILNNNIKDIDEEIKENANNFVEIVEEFNEKTINRTACERTRRTVEGRYNKKLNEILDHYKEIDFEKAEKAKNFINLDTEDIEEELKQKVEENGEKEKIPFNVDVITKAICLCVDIQKRETEIIAGTYDKTNKLFTEIKNNNVRLEKHKKNIKDSNSKLEFISAIKEYLFQFLDNERLTVVNGEVEHAKLMKDACEHLDQDLAQINNLYTLLLKEISKKITKKSYTELYKLDYLKELEKKSDEFDKKIRKLELPVTIINPNYWRIEGMKRIYDVFYKCVTEDYERDLSEYFEDESKYNLNAQDLNDDFEDDIEENIEEEKDIFKPNIKNDFEEEFEINKKSDNLKSSIKNKIGKKKKESAKEELDKKIDMILGFNNDILKNEKKEKDEDADGEEDSKYEDFENNLFDEKNEKLETQNNEDEEDDLDLDLDLDFDFGEDDDEDDYNDDDDDDFEWDDESTDIDDIEEDPDDIEDVLNFKFDNEDDEPEIIKDEEDWDDDFNDDFDDEDIDEEPVKATKSGKKTKNNKKVTKDKKNKNDKKPTTKNLSKKASNKTKENDDWGNEFIKMDKKEKKGKHVKKKGFFDKFKK